MVVGVIILSILLLVALGCLVFIFFQYRQLRDAYNSVMSGPRSSTEVIKVEQPQQGSSFTPAIYSQREAFLRRLVSSSAASDTTEAAMGVINSLLSETDLQISYVSLFTWAERRKQMVLLGTNIDSKFTKAIEHHANELHVEVVHQNIAAYTRNSSDALSYKTARERGVHFEYYIPLFRGDNLIGAVLVESKNPNAHTVLNLEFFQLVLENINLVLYNIVLLQRVLQQANTDNLTQLYNRTYLRVFETGLVQSRIPYSVILMDIDFFKKCNDNYGHAVGDIVLRTVAGVLATSVREGFDGVFRYGGEEFLIILRDADVNLAHERAEAIRQRIASLVIPYAPDKSLKVTISLGVKQADVNMRLDQNITCADKALYWSKEHGRNRVSVYSPEMEGSTK